MNGYSNNGFTQSLNGILSLTDGLGTTIQNGEIITGNITGNDIISSSISTTTLKSLNHELSGNLIVDVNLSVGGTSSFTGIITANEKINGTSLKLTNDLSVSGISTLKSCLNIDSGTSGKCIDLAYGDSTRTDNFYGTIQYNKYGSGVSISGDQTNKRVDIYNKLYVHGDLSIDSTGTIYSNLIKDYNNNLYLTTNNIYGDGISNDVGFNNVAVGSYIGCGYLNCSNNLTSINIISNDVSTTNLKVDNIPYKNHLFVGNINIGSLGLTLPLSNGSINDTSTYYTNLNLQTYLIYSLSNNSVIINPYYSLIFYNNNNILQIIDNSTGTNILYSLISFNQNLTCTSIIIQFKNKNI